MFALEPVGPFFPSWASTYPSVDITLCIIIVLITITLSVIVVYCGCGKGAKRDKMDIEYDDDSLKQLACDPKFDAGFGRDVVKAYRKRIQVISAAPDERDFY